MTTRTRERKCIKEFILLYETLPFLWNKSHKDYRNPKLSSTGYDKLAKKLREIEPKADKYAVTRKIRCLRTAFRQELRKYTAQRRRGEATYKPKLWYFKLLSFIGGSSGLRKSVLRNTTVFPEKKIIEDVQSEYEDLEYLEEPVVDNMDTDNVDCEDRKPTNESWVTEWIENDMDKTDVPIEIEIKSEFEGVCQCCLGDKNLRAMLELYHENGKSVFYAEWLQLIYPNFNFDDNNGIETQYLICEQCIKQLRAAVSFVEKVKSVQRILNPSADGDVNDSMKPSLRTAKRDKKSNVTKKKRENFTVQSEKKCTKKKKVTGKHYKQKIKGGQSYIPKTVLEKPFPTDPKDLKCKICTISFTAYHKLCRHMAEHYPNFTCDVCGRNFVTRTSLQSHLRLRHYNTMVSCKICTKSVKKTSMRRHLWTHTKGGYKYKCNVCPETFTSYLTKTSHMIKAHNKTQIKHKCDVCYRDFLNTAALGHHFRRTHMKLRNAACEVCDKTFYSSSGLKRHIIKHIGSRDFVCSVCNKGYSSRNSLLSHMYVHNSIKRFECDKCKRQFTYKCALVHHLEQHEKKVNKKIVTTRINHEDDNVLYLIKSE